MIVSILLPSIRPDLLRLRMQEYARLALPGPCEVVVVSDGMAIDTTPPQPGLTIQHLMQPRQGNVPATNLAFQAAAGEYVVATNDEVELDPQFLMALVRAGEATGERALLSGSQEPYCSNDYYGVFFANCPFGRRRFFQSLAGGFFDPAYHAFYADPDLALRVHALGIAVTKVPDARCTHRLVYEADGHFTNHHAYYHQDQHTFTTRWAHLGPFQRDPSLR